MPTFWDWMPDSDPPVLMWGQAPLLLRPLRTVGSPWLCHVALADLGTPRLPQLRIQLQKSTIPYLLEFIELFGRSLLDLAQHRKILHGGSSIRPIERTVNLIEPGMNRDHAARSAHARRRSLSCRAALQFPELLFQLASLTTGRYRPRILEHLKLLTQGANLLERIVARPQVPGSPLFRHEHCLQISSGCGYARIHADLQLLRLRHTIDSQPDVVFPWYNCRPERTHRRIVRDRRNGIVTLHRLRPGIPQVPGPAMHSRRSRKNRLLPQPVCGHIDAFGIEGLRLVVTAKAPNQFASGIKNLQRHKFRPVLQHIVENRTIRRVLPHGRLGRQRSVWVRTALNARGGLRLEELGLGSVAFVNLAQWSDVIQNPERPPMGPENNVIAVDDEIAHGSVRQVELQRVPVAPVIERHPHGTFRAGKEQAGQFRVFANRVHGGVIRDALGNLLPGPPAVVRAVDVSMQIIEPKAVD